MPAAQLSALSLSNSNPIRPPRPSSATKKEMASWDALVDAALATLSARKLLFNTRLITLAPPPALTETFAGPESWDRATVEIQVDRNSLQQWLTTSQCPACLPCMHVHAKFSTSRLTERLNLFPFFSEC